MFSLKGKRALVTGGSQGIGRGIALSLAKQGADVAINYNSSTEKAAEVVVSLQELGADSFAVKADVSSKAQIVKMFETVREKWGKLDILVNNAGVLSYAPFEKITEEQWDKVIDVNLKGQFLCSQQAVKLMSKGSKIVNIASIASGGVGVGVSNIAHYTASKGGVVALTENMAVDLAEKGINVNCIAPGAIRSNMTKGIEEDKQQMAGILARVPKKRIGEPKEIGAAVCFLVSDEADYVDGTVLYVDGGWLAV